MDMKTNPIFVTWQAVYLTLWPALQIIYGISYWPILVLHILVSVRTWQYTVTYDYFCGNPLMGAWSLWFRISLVAGLILVPGGLWALKYRRKLVGIIYGVGFLLYVASTAFTLAEGVTWGMVPDFIHFPPGL